jgi:hypothetical protein
VAGDNNATGGMGSRAVVVRQFAFVDDDDIFPAEFREMIGAACTNNAGADNDQTGVMGYAVPPFFKLSLTLKLSAFIDRSSDGSG